MLKFTKIQLQMMNEEELNDVLTDVINEREGVRNDLSKKALTLDELYHEVCNELGIRTKYDLTKENVSCHKKGYEVVFSFAGEGYNGDYDDCDFDDAPLLRADIYKNGNNMEPAYSACTWIPATISRDLVKSIAKTMLDLIVAGKWDPEKTLTSVADLLNMAEKELGIELQSSFETAEQEA